jgi:XTP/dITP diphosphohydrolase
VKLVKIIIASLNKHKVFEFKQIFYPFGIGVNGLPEGRNYVPPPENGKTFSENADIKAIYYSSLIDDFVLADDSGLCVESLHGKPGIYSSRFAGPDARDEDNTSKLLDLMRNIQLPELRKACFKCFLSLARKGQIIRRTNETVRGHILKEPCGKGGFGYDPVFYYKRFNKTFAEIADELKNQISHRYRASKKMAEYIRQENTG